MRKHLLLFSLLAVFLTLGANKAAADDDLTGKSPATTLVDGGYYYIVNNQDAFYTKKGKHVAFYYDESDAGNVYWNQISATNPNFVFQLKKKSDNVWTIRNCASDQYIKGSAFEGATFGLGEYEHTFYPQDNGSYKIRNASTGSTYALYTDNSGYGANTKNPVGCNHWSADLESGTYANWDFYEVDATIAAEAEALGAENAATFVTEIEDGGYYYIVNDYHKYTDKPDVDIAFWNEADNLRWKQLDITDYNYIFKATKDSDGKVALQNVLSKKYIGTGSPAKWQDNAYYHVVTDAADAAYAPHLGTGTGLFKIVNSDGGGNPLGPGCIVCGGTRYANIGQEGHTVDNSSYSSADKGYVGRWKFYKVPQKMIDALLYGIPVADLSQLSEDKYYYIISQFDGFRSLGNGVNSQNYEGKEAGMGYSSDVAGNVCWVVQKRAEPTANVVWNIVKDGDNYQLKNVGSGKYAGAAGDGNKIGWTDEYEVAQKITSTSNGNFTIGNAASSNTNTWKIAGGFHGKSADYLTAATGGNGYSSTTGTERAWKIYELTDAQVQAMCNELIQQLQGAVNSGIGVVSGIKDDASMTAAKSVLAAEPNYDELKAALKNYVLNLGTGYWYFRNENGNKEYMNVKPAFTYPYSDDPYDYVMCQVLDADKKSDYSTVWAITDKGDGTYTMSSQGLYIANRYWTARPHRALALQSQAMKYGAYIGTGKVWVQVSKEDGGWTDHPYIMKNPSSDVNDKRVNCYSTIGGGEATLKWTVTPATDITVALHSAEGYYWATLYVPFGVTLPEGTEAYVANVNENDKLALTSLGQNVPAATPVILRGDAAEITATINSEIAAYEGSNKLSGKYLASESQSDDVYSLGVKGGVVGFYTISSALGANKAYLAAADAPSKGFVFTFEDDDITGISNEKLEIRNSANIYYDLQGRKVEAPKAGQLYIVNGKVVKY